MKKKTQRAKRAVKSQPRLPITKQRSLEALLDYLAIHAIRLERIHVERSPMAEVDPVKAISIHSEGALEGSGNQRWLTYVFAFDAQMRLKDKNIEGLHEGVIISASFRIVYATKPDLPEMTEDNINDIGRLVASGNVWPYWREIVQSVTVRMGLPPLLMPLVTPHQFASDN